MINPPVTKQQAETYAYGARASQPGGKAFDPSKCAYAVWYGKYSIFERQCSNKPTAGPENLYCKSHARKVALMVKTGEVAK